MEPILLELLSPGPLDQHGHGAQVRFVVLKGVLAFPVLTPDFLVNLLIHSTRTTEQRTSGQVCKGISWKE